MKRSNDFWRGTFHNTVLAGCIVIGSLFATAAILVGWWIPSPKVTAIAAFAALMGAAAETVCRYKRDEPR